MLKNCLMHPIDEDRWISIPDKCVFDETKFCIYIRTRIADDIETIKKEAH